MPYSLKDVNTRSIREVKQSILEIATRLYGPAVGDFVHPLVDMAETMFDGEYRHYGKVTTEYHNREHTLQATLCLVRLLEGLHISGDPPRLDMDHFRIGLAGILYHDIGYLQDRADTSGTGARYTLEHEERSCRMAAEVLEEMGWKIEDVAWVRTLIRCTGPRSLINEIAFADDAQQFLARAVCTADYLGQMADYRYLEKLPVLFEEFQESDDYQGTPPEKRMFQSAEDLVSKTPGFWEFVKSKVLHGDCDDVYRYLARPPGSEDNPYFRKIDRNIARIRSLVEDGRIAAFVREVRQA